MSSAKLCVAVLVMLALVVAVAVLTSNQKQACLKAGYTSLSGQLWEPYCVRKGALGQDEIRRLSELKEQ